MKTQLHYLKTLQNSFSEIATKRVLERRLQKMKMVKSSCSGDIQTTGGRREYYFQTRFCSKKF